MIFDISDAGFKRIFNDELLFLPIRWDGADFSMTLNSLFDHYIKQIEATPISGAGHSKRVEDEVKKVCGLLIKTVDYYLNGFPSKAYGSFEKVMHILMKQSLQIYQKSVLEQFENSDGFQDDKLKLFRAVAVEDNRPYQRIRVFHTPYNLRSKVSTSRYSIAGYPSLYLGTSLGLCCEEIQMNPHKNFTIASMFKLERNFEYTNTNIRVIELGVKPQDFVYENISEQAKRRIDSDMLRSPEVRSAYLLWYPLIATCSYIRVNKKDSFAAEYVIPQLLMQWVRCEIAKNRGEDYDQLIGIRYFSCASIKASNMGFNYVFPTSGQQKSAGLPYCAVLAKAFRLTNPIYIHEYENIAMCESALKTRRDFDFIM